VKGVYVKTDQGVERVEQGFVKESQGVSKFFQSAPVAQWNK